MDFSEAFTQSVREVLPCARRKNLACYFDYAGPRLQLSNLEVGVRAAAHRLLLGIVDCFDSGFVMFSAEAGTPCNGVSRLLIHAAGTGATSREAIEQVLNRLALQSEPAVGTPDGRMPRAEGICPATGGRAQFVDAGADGLVLSLELMANVTEPDSGAVPDAGGARAWLISPMAGTLDSLTHRLRRCGWIVEEFTSTTKASVQLRQPKGAAPKLLIAAESSGDELLELEQLAAANPSLWTVLGVVFGSGTVRHRGHTPVDIRVLPLSPAELDRFTAHVDWRMSTQETRDTAPGPLYVREVRRVLVVDDNLVNQVVAKGQLEALGYDVTVASDGVEALNSCRNHPPDMVLMDLDMPVMDGLTATVKLRSSQAAGLLPPFPIVAATSGETERATCTEAGMDGYLSKPMDLVDLAEELERLLPTRPAELGE